MANPRRTPPRRPDGRSGAGSAPARSPHRTSRTGATVRPQAPARAVRATDHAEIPTPPSRIALTGRAAILAVVLVVLIVSFAYPMRSWFNQRSELADLRSQVAADEQAIHELNRSIDRWDDDEYVKAQARDRLRYVLPGEVGYVVIGEDFAEPDPDEAMVAPVWWQQLWTGVEEADRADLGGAPAPTAPTTVAPSPPSSPSAEPTTTQP